MGMEMRTGLFSVPLFGELYDPMDRNKPYSTGGE